MGWDREEEGVGDGRDRCDGSRGESGRVGVGRESCGNSTELTDGGRGADGADFGRPELEAEYDPVSSSVSSPSSLSFFFDGVDSACCCSESGGRPTPEMASIDRQSYIC